MNGYDVRCQLNGKDAERQVDSFTQGEDEEIKKEKEAIKANLVIHLFLNVNGRHKVSNISCPRIFFLETNMLGYNKFRSSSIRYIYKYLS